MFHTGIVGVKAIRGRGVSPEDVYLLYRDKEFADVLKRWIINAHVRSPMTTSDVLA